jgi:hypothetical protein
MTNSSSPSFDVQGLEQTLRSSKTVAGGFLAADVRSLDRIIADDLALLSKYGLTARQLGRRMQDVTDRAKAGLGAEVAIGEGLVAWCDEWKGLIVCPWPHGGRFDKRLTLVRQSSTGRTIRWTDLNIHLILEHGFFEGKGAEFRLEPQELADLLFAKA